MKPGADSFDVYYEELYGTRWKFLRECLLQPASTVSYTEGLVVPYYLDFSSILAALSLRLPEDSVDSPGAGEDKDKPPLVLDACAAPGGKTLVIASHMAGSTSLLANEISSERRRRLVTVLDKHLPEETRRRVTISGFDAAAAAGRKSERGRFTGVLLDAPCSSERHVIQNPAALDQWTPSRPRFLARRQWALLSAAFLLLSPGGSLVYSTCSINTEENDGVVKRLLEKYGDECIVDRPEFKVSVDRPWPEFTACLGTRAKTDAVPGVKSFFPEAEETRYGFLILPDRAEGAGPMYIARFRKKPAIPPRTAAGL